MNIDETYKANLWNLESLAKYLSTDREVLVEHYEKLRADTRFMNEVNEQIDSVRKIHGFRKGIFKMESVPSVDWFAFERILLYVLVRHLKPKFILETGVYYGGNSLFILKALADNKNGKLVSIDYPDSTIREAGGGEDRHPEVGDTEFYTAGLAPGFIVSDHLKSAWTLVIGDSHQEIPKRPEFFDLYVHDSDHSMDFLRTELNLAREHMTENGFVVVDDIDWSNGFFEFCVKHRLYPVLFTDNGKNNLRVRLGLACLTHPKNGSASYTG